MSPHAAIAGSLLSLGAVAAPAPDVPGRSLPRPPAHDAFPTCPNPASFATGAPALDAALLNLCSREANPSASIRAALGSIARSSTCFPDTMTREEWQAVIDRFDLLPPTLLHQLDFWIDTSVAWQGASAQGTAARAQAASLTYSFADDGVTWGLSSVSSVGPNDLNAKLEGLFGAGNLDLGREYLRQALACWRKHAGLTYTEVADDGIPENENTPPYSALNPSGGGDIRIGGLGFGTPSFLAYNAFPSDAFAGVGGGDMCFNTSYFRVDLPSFHNPANDFRYIRNTTAHEHGHGTGNIHAVPCNQTKLMEPSIGAALQDMMGIDDIRGAGRNYGDRFSGNQSAATATALGDLASPAPRSVLELDLSTNGTAGFGNTDEDWFRFTLASPRSVVIAADPTGGSYMAQQQTSGCTGSGSTINADIAGNLNIELRNAAGTTVLQNATTAAAGVTETLNAGTLAAGEYTIRVFDVGPNATANQRVQLYNLLVRVDDAFAPPQAIAGIPKRISANANCFFIGDINSRPTETGATIASYEWDLDGDNSFETAGAKPSLQYISNGVYPVSLRVIDSNGTAAVDTINVTVFGAVTALDALAPGAGGVGETVPVVITGVNLRTVAASSEFTISGAGVAVSGTPVPSAMGDEVTGLSLVIDAGAAPGPRDLTITNGEGTATLADAFIVQGAGPCPGDANGDNQVNFADLNIVLSNFGQTGAPGTIPGDVNNDGQINFSDLNIVLSFFGTFC